MQIGNLEDTCSRQADYINQLEDYANGIEAQLQAMQQVCHGNAGSRFVREPRRCDIVATVVRHAW